MLTLKYKLHFCVLHHKELSIWTPQNRLHRLALLAWLVIISHYCVSINLLWEKGALQIAEKKM